jgi:hypothetical protein
VIETTVLAHTLLPDGTVELQLRIDDPDIDADMVAELGWPTSTVDGLVVLAATWGRGTAPEDPVATLRTSVRLAVLDWARRWYGWPIDLAPLP